MRWLPIGLVHDVLSTPVLDYPMPVRGQNLFVVLLQFLRVLRLEGGSESPVRHTHLDSHIAPASQVQCSPHPLSPNPVPRDTLVATPVRDLQDPSWGRLYALALTRPASSKAATSAHVRWRMAQPMSSDVLRHAMSAQSALWRQTGAMLQLAPKPYWPWPRPVRKVGGNGGSDPYPEAPPCQGWHRVVAPVGVEDQHACRQIRSSTVNDTRRAVPPLSPWVLTGS